MSSKVTCSHHDIAKTFSPFML